MTHAPRPDGPERAGSDDVTHRPGIDPVEAPARRADLDAPLGTGEHTATRRPNGDARTAEHTRAAATWTGLVIGILVLILLLIFIVQNLDRVTMHFLGWDFTLPIGVSLLLAAIAGALVMTLAGGIRIVQVKRAAKRSRRRR